MIPVIWGMILAVALEPFISKFSGMLGGRRSLAATLFVLMIGALGGMMLFGIIGLFVGAVVLAIMYTVFTAWIDEIEPVNE